MATTEYRNVNRTAQTPINPTVNQAAAESSNNRTALWIVVAIVALAAIAFSMGMFGPADEGSNSATMASDTYSSQSSPATTPSNSAMTPSQ